MRGHNHAWILKKTLFKPVASMFHRELGLKEGGKSHHWLRYREKRERERERKGPPLPI